MNGHSGKAVAEVFDDFVISQTAQDCQKYEILKESSRIVISIYRTDTQDITKNEAAPI